LEQRFLLYKVGRSRGRIELGDMEDRFGAIQHRPDLPFIAQVDRATPRFACGGLRQATYRYD
jgi:hypothetical protein